MSIALPGPRAARRPFGVGLPLRTLVRHPGVIVGALCGTLVAVLLVAFHSATVGSYFYDPDDALRLVMVRDWLAGQPWGDVWQHRLQPGGTQMHWSRLDDLPVAAVIVALRGWVGQGAAERVAMTAWPVALVPVLFAVVASVSGKGALRIGVAMATLCCGALLDRFMPGRIDHHALMTTLAAAACVTLLARPSASMGAIAGVASVLCLAVGFEDLPVLGVLGGLVTVLWAVGRERSYPLGYGLGVLATAAFVEVAFVPDGARLATACDCLSGGWVLALAVAGAGLASCARWVSGPRAVARFLPLVAIGGGGISSLALTGTRRCLAGPYPDLSATAKAYWLDGVGEMVNAFSASGGDWHVFAPSFMAIGLVLCLLWVRDRTPTLRECCYVVAFAVAAAFGIRYIRSSGLPVVLAAPVVARGAAWMLAGTTGTRVAGFGVVCATLLPAVLLVREVRDDRLPGGASDPHMVSCETRAAWTDVAALPPGNAVAPVDVGPDMLAFSPHTALSAGIHRAFVGLDEQYRFMQGSEEEALAVARREHLDYVVWCDDVSEIHDGWQWNPKGIATMLANGRLPPWLHVVPGNALAKVARIDRDALAAPGRDGTPFR